MNKVRLLCVAETLQNVHRKDFDFKSNENCALGYASRTPYFQKLGFKLLKTRNVFKYKGKYGRYAAANLFDITGLQADALFCTGVVNTLHKSDNPTPKQVALAIRKFVKSDS